MTPATLVPGACVSIRIGGVNRGRYVYAGRDHDGSTLIFVGWVDGKTIRLAAGDMDGVEIVEVAP